LYGLAPALSNGAVAGRERLTSIERSVSASATVACVNGDFFAANGVPSGIVLRGGALDHAPQSDRSSIGVAADGSLRVEQVAYAGVWKGTGPRRPLRLNEPPSPNGVSLLTRSWGATTPSFPGAVEAVLPAVPSTVANADLSATATQVGSSNGGTAIPRGGGILMARGTSAARL